MTRSVRSNDIGKSVRVIEALSTLRVLSHSDLLYFRSVYEACRLVAVACIEMSNYGVAR